MPAEKCCRDRWRPVESCTRALSSISRSAINSLGISGCNKGMPGKRPCPCWRREFRVRKKRARARTRPRLSSPGPWFTLPGSLAAGRARCRQPGSQGGQGQEFLGVRECLAHIATSLSPGNQPGRALSRPFANSRKDVLAD